MCRLLFFISLLLFSVLAFAQGVPLPASPAMVEMIPTAVPQTDFFSTVGGQILGALLPVISAFLAALLGWVLSLLAKKIGFSLNTQRDAVTREAVRKAIAYAEEYAAKQLKIESNPEGTEKLKIAMEQLLKQFPDKLPAELDRMIHEELGSMKGFGASKEISV